jgi:hypothetical protein
MENWGNEQPPALARQRIRQASFCLAGAFPASSIRDGSYSGAISSFRSFRRPITNDGYPAPGSPRFAAQQRAPLEDRPFPPDMKTLLVTGSSGLIGSEVCVCFAREGYRIHGIDNNQRAVFFGPQGDTRWNQQRLIDEIPGFEHHELDIRDREGVLELVRELKPSAIVHTAAQPSHDRAAAIPFDDFDTNAVGTLNLLEAARQACPESPFVHMSTNKVYGDAPNRIPN